jgi:uncharacterized membrane protein
LGAMATLEASWTVEIGAPRERCYEVAADVEHSPEWQGTLEEVEVLERDRDGRALVVETLSDAMVKKVRSWLRFAYDPPGGLTWEQEKGETKWLTGSWTFEELADGRTRATYALRTDPGRVLSLLLRGPIEGKVKEFLTKSAAEGLKKHVEEGEARPGA